MTNKIIPLTEGSRFSEMEHARTLHNSDLLVLNQKSEEQLWEAVTTTLEEVVEASISSDAGNVLTLGTDNRLFLNVNDYVDINTIDIAETSSPSASARKTHIQVGSYIIEGYTSSDANPPVSYLTNFPKIMSPLSTFYMPLQSTFILPFTAVEATFKDLKLTALGSGDFVSAQLTQVDETQGYITFVRDATSSAHANGSTPSTRSFRLEDPVSGIFKVFCVNLTYAVTNFYIRSASAAGNKLTMKSVMYGAASFHATADIFSYTVVGVIDGEGNAVTKPLKFSVVEPSGYFGEVVAGRYNANYYELWCNVFIHEPFVGQVAVTVQGMYSGQTMTQLFAVNIP